MSEENQTAPPLDLDLNTIKTDMPLLADGLYELQFSKVEPKQSKAGQPMLSLDLVTTSAAMALTGEQLGAGIHVFDNLNLAASGKATWDMVTRNVASVVQATSLATNWGEFCANAPALLQGQIVRCKVGNEPAGVDKNGKSFRAKNTIVLWMKKGQ